MLKSIIKAVATPERLSGYAADGIQRGVNGTADETAATVESGKILRHLAGFLLAAVLHHAHRCFTSF